MRKLFCRVVKHWLFSMTVKFPSLEAFKSQLDPVLNWIRQSSEVPANFIIDSVAIMEWPLLWRKLKFSWEASGSAHEDKLVRDCRMSRAEDMRQTKISNSQRTCERGEGSRWPVARSQGQGKGNFMEYKYWYSGIGLVVINKPTHFILMK